MKIQLTTQVSDNVSHTTTFNLDGAKFVLDNGQTLEVVPIISEVLDLVAKNIKARIDRDTTK